MYFKNYLSILLFELQNSESLININKNNDNIVTNKESYFSKSYVLKLITNLVIKDENKISKLLNKIQKYIK